MHACFVFWDFVGPFDFVVGHPRLVRTLLRSHVTKHRRLCFVCDLRQWRRGACRSDYNTTSTGTVYGSKKIKGEVGAKSI